MGCGSGMTCWRRLHEWQQASVWERLHRVLLDRLGWANAIDWSRAAVDSASVPAKRGRGDRSEPDGSWQAGLEAPPPGRRQRHPARFEDLPGQPPRQPAHRGTRRCRAADPPVRRPAAPKARQAPPDRPARHREQRAPGTTPMGGRAHTGLVRPLPPHRCPYERRADIFRAFHHIAASLVCRRFVQRWFC